MITTKNWFDVDRDGLRKMLAGRGHIVPVMELLQNAWDQNVTRVDVLVEPIAGRPFARIIVKDDDPVGFHDLTHAFTLFADSIKRKHPWKRGRFNLGEKLVLACCERAEIATTTGTVLFDKTGRHVYPRRRRTHGSVFDGEVRMTREQIDEVARALRTAIPPRDVQTTINGIPLQTREPIAKWKALLLTEKADDEGVLRRLQRLTDVCAYVPRAGEVGTLYELGIPVVETGDQFHVDVGQKVPLTLDRTNVPPSFLRDVRVGLLNATAYLLTTREEATAPWVREGATRADPQAMDRVLDLRFGSQRVAYDVSDPEANRLATARGYTVVTGGALSAEEWENAKRAEAILPAGRVTPSPRPFSASGDPLRIVTDLTPRLIAFVTLVRALAREAIGVDIDVVLADDHAWGFSGCYGSRRVTINLAKFGGAESYFTTGVTGEAMVALLIHEFAHHNAPGHLTAAFYDECCRIGALFATRNLIEGIEDVVDCSQYVGRSND